VQAGATPIAFVFAPREPLREILLALVSVNSSILGADVLEAVELALLARGAAGRITGSARIGVVSAARKPKRQGQRYPHEKT
jgi:hypothetical protein